MGDDGAGRRPLRWLVTGASGQVGSDLLRVLRGGRGGTDAHGGVPADGDGPSRGDGNGRGEPHDVVLGLPRAALDVTDGAAVDAALGVARPDVVLNAAGYTAVDAAESDEEAAYAGNAMAPANLAKACAVHGARLVHLSTDYVFAGTAGTPYEVDAPTAPRSVYGRTKLAGERAVRELCEQSYVVRTAWVYGQTGGNFVRTIGRLARAGEPFDVVDDQHGSPTWSRDLARGLVALGRSGAPYGVYHCTNAGQTTWYGLARAVCEEMGLDPRQVRPTTSAAMRRAAPRPAYSVLSGASWAAAGLPALPHWRDALRDAFSQVGDALLS